MVAVQPKTSRSHAVHGKIKWPKVTTEMFINKETGKPVMLTDETGNVVTFIDGSEEKQLPSSDFHSTHREATREEIDGGSVSEKTSAKK